MKFKIFLKSTIILLCVTATYAVSDDNTPLATEVADFIRRPVLHNFIQNMRENNRWEPWGATISRPTTFNSTKMTALEPYAHETTRVHNFILPGFGCQLDSFFLHDTAGTERCEDAIRVEILDEGGVNTAYLSVAYCLGSGAKTFILGSDRASIVHIYKYVNNALSCTYTALCPVRAEFGCYLNGYDGIYGREKEIIFNNRVAQSPYFDEERYGLNFIREYLRQAAHIMIDSKEDIVQHAIAHEGHFCNYDIACHMANLAAGRNGLSERLYRRGVSALIDNHAMLTDESSCVSGRTSEASISSDESDDCTSCYSRGKSTKECAGQIMRVCAFSLKFLITSWDNRDISITLEQWGITAANGKCIVDEKWSEFALIKRLRREFAGVIPYFFDNVQLFSAVYERKLNYLAVHKIRNLAKRKKVVREVQLIQTAVIDAEEQPARSVEEGAKKRKSKLKIHKKDT